MRTLTLAALLLATCLADRQAVAGDDPEPPGSGPARLRGKWVSVRRIQKGKETDYVNQSTYAFQGDKVRYTWKTQDYSMKVELDKKRPHAMTLTKDQTPPKKYHYKIEKGELWLTLDRSNDPNSKPDFKASGVSSVFIYKREK
jgi:uncharacterized protein (TIGR03067 family)